MEVNLEGRLRRMERLARPDGGKKDVPAAESPAPRPKTDSVSSSRQAAEQMADQSRRLAALVRQDRQAEKKPFLWDMLDGEEKTGNSEADALGEQMKAMERCHKIAARILRGDKVPPQDERYLMMNDPDGYKLALAMRRPKKHPKKWESVLKEEEKKRDGASAAESSGREGVEPSGSGGEAPASGE